MNSSKEIQENIIEDKYKKLFVTKAGVSVLEGIDEKLSLPLHSNIPNAIYGILAQDETYLTEIRFYDEQGNIIIELANHPKSITVTDISHMCILHYHTYQGRKRQPGKRIKEHPEIETKYYNYIQELIEL